MILTIVGARPQFVKASVVSRALSDAGIEEMVVHTGQHYDANMSAIFWEQLKIPPPKVNLEIGSLSHGEQTAQMISGIEKTIETLGSRPNGVLLYGDTNSTLAGAIVGSKRNDTLIYHVEAGLRSWNKNMPEEVNRIITDHVSDYLFCSSDEGVKNLDREGIHANVFNVGDVMLDAVTAFSNGVYDVPLGISDKFILLTLHRPSNTDDTKAIERIMIAIEKIGMDVVWPIHPRCKKVVESIELPKNITVVEPLGYLQMLGAIKKCNLVLTDSGGLQKEAYWLKKKCVTLRSETEWVETLENGWNTLVGNNTEKIIEAFKIDKRKEWKPLYGDGRAANRIADVISKSLLK